MFNFNYNQSDRVSTMLLDEGIATFSITGVASADKDGNPLVTKAKSIPYINIHMIIEDIRGATSRHSHMLMSSRGDVIFALGMAIGIDIYNEAGIFDEQILVGKCGKCVVVHDEYNNMTRNKIAEFLPTEEPVKSYSPFGE